MRFFGSWRVFLAALAVVAVFVVLARPSTATAAQRVGHLESLVRCPACEDISVAQSNSPSAIAVREEIVRRVGAGQSDEVIISALESRYGSSILLSPRGNALDALLWVVPLVVLVGGVLVWATVARHRT